MGTWVYGCTGVVPVSVPMAAKPHIVKYSPLPLDTCCNLMLLPVPTHAIVLVSSAATETPAAHFVFPTYTSIPSKVSVRVMIRVVALDSDRVPVPTNRSRGTHSINSKAGLDLSLQALDKPRVVAVCQLDGVYTP